MLRVLITLALGVSVFAASARGIEPNFILILADDLGPGDLGGPVAPTPHLDRMAREGTRFERYYSVSPICSPSRCGLLTGQFPARWRITSYLQTRAGNRACEQNDFLDPKAPSLPRTLKQAGYATAHVGKWHLGGGRDVANPPKFAAYGYDFGLGTWESPEPAAPITARDWIWSAVDPVKRWDRTGWMADRALDFLDAHPQQPCFVNLWLDDPHTPWVPSAEDQNIGENGRATGKGDTLPRLKRVMIELDRQVGRLLDAIRARKSDRPTIVLFMSDNGPLPPFPNQMRTNGLRGSKLSLYEGGVRLPLIAWSPGLVASGRTDAETTLAAVDFFPTICRLSGAKLPDDYAGDGEEMSQALLGQRTQIRSRPIFWEYGRNATAFGYPKPENRSPNLALLDADWKLLVNDDGQGAELYNLASDPREAKNLAAEQPERTAKLSETLLRWRKSLP